MLLCVCVCVLCVCEGGCKEHTQWLLQQGATLASALRTHCMSTPCRLRGARQGGARHAFHPMLNARGTPIVGVACAYCPETSDMLLGLVGDGTEDQAL